MATTKKNQLKEIMILAWQFVKNNGFTMGEALKVAWMNFKLKAALKVKSVVFHFKKKTARQEKRSAHSKGQASTPRGQARQAALCKCSLTLKNRRGGRSTNGIYYALKFNATM